ncbi:hypothetical protein L1987_55831 [Smallanthus sonchifolius]|uniref:Uncharacterized protein n=1 Tax=Smallanthus sonchifolius TaxID=185202 RepID=A0ACB9EAR9_9ASTR|nr:hypothetical protein L1987_55831 [Smallanthus sonchifolius]
MEIVSQKKLICLLMLLLCQHQQMSQGEHLDLRLKLIFLHLHLQVLRFLQLLVFFASHPASSAVSPAVDFFAAPEQVEPEIKPLESKTRIYRAHTELHG